VASNRRDALEESNMKKKSEGKKSEPKIDKGRKVPQNSASEARDFVGYSKDHSPIKSSAGNSAKASAGTTNPKNKHTEVNPSEGSRDPKKKRPEYAPSSGVCNE
jgi:hypothetical protein